MASTSTSTRLRQKAFSDTSYHSSARWLCTRLVHGWVDGHPKRLKLKSWLPWTTFELLREETCVWRVHRAAGCSPEKAGGGGSRAVLSKPPVPHSRAFTPHTGVADAICQPLSAKGVRRQVDTGRPSSEQRAFQALF